jgi:acyl carrier protein
MTIQQALYDYIQSIYFKDSVPKDFDENYDLVENGILDSLGIIGLMNYLEQQYKIEFGDQDFVPENFSSINALVSFVERNCAVASA